MQDETNDNEDDDEMPPRCDSFKFLRTNAVSNDFAHFMHARVLQSA